MAPINAKYKLNGKWPSCNITFIICVFCILRSLLLFEFVNCYNLQSVQRLLDGKFWFDCVLLILTNAVLISVPV